MSAKSFPKAAKAAAAAGLIGLAALVVPSQIAGADPDNPNEHFNVEGNLSLKFPGTDSGSKNTALTNDVDTTTDLTNDVDTATSLTNDVDTDLTNDVDTATSLTNDVDTDTALTNDVDTATSLTNDVDTTTDTKLSNDVTTDTKTDLTTAPKTDIGPNDWEEAEIEDGAGVLGFFSASSIWPFVMTIAIMIMAYGLGFWHLWLVVFGAVVLIWSGTMLNLQYGLPAEKH